MVAYENREHGNDHVISRIVVRCPATTSHKVRFNLAEKDTSIGLSTTLWISVYYPINLYENFDLLQEVRRLMFARQYHNWAVQRSMVLFPDESSMQRMSAHTRGIREQGEKYNNDSNCETPSKLDDMGCNVYSRYSEFLASKTTMNESRFLYLLREKIKFHVDVHRCPAYWDSVS